MLFAVWMKKNGIEDKDVVAEVKRCGHEISAGMVKKVRKGLRRRFSPEIIRIIEDWSKKKVTWRELSFPEEYRKASGE